MTKRGLAATVAIFTGTTATTTMSTAAATVTASANSTAANTNTTTIAATEETTMKKMMKVITTVVMAKGDPANLFVSTRLQSRPEANDSAFDFYATASRRILRIHGV